MSRKYKTEFYILFIKILGIPLKKLFKIIKMESVIIQRKIELTPDSLYNYREIILEKLNAFYTDKCFKEYGLVKSVEKNIRIIDNIVSRVNCNIIFNVEFTLTILNVSIGKEFKMIVEKINPKYIIGNIEKKISVLVSPETMVGYVYKDDCFCKGKKRITIGGEITIKVSKTKYKNLDEIMVIGEYIQNIQKN
jgi:DNA-directed RNA polymerase subunit E'/Rpb7